MPGTLFVVATPIGNLEDITLRALRVLREAAVVAAEDTRRTSLLLQHFGVPTRTVSLHDHNERSRTPALIARLVAGESIALVSDSGTPVVSDPGLHFIRAAIEAGVPVVPVPGASAVMAALSVSGLAVGDFSFVGFPPARAGARDRWIEALRARTGTLVLFEAPHRVAATLRAVLEILGNRQVVVARELTKLHETVIRGWLEDVVNAEIPEKGEFTVLLSDQFRPEQRPSVESDASSIAAEFCQLTEHGGLSRRDAVARLAVSHGMTRQAVYKSLAGGRS